jgi:hypothetical protein
MYIEGCNISYEISYTGYHDRGAQDLKVPGESHALDAAPKAPRDCVQYPIMASRYISFVAR